MGKLSGTDVGDAGSGMVGELNTSIMEMSASGRHIMSLSALSSAAYGESGKHVMSLSWLTSGVVSPPSCLLGDGAGEEKSSGLKSRFSRFDTGVEGYSGGVASLSAESWDGDGDVLRWRRLRRTEEDGETGGKGEGDRGKS